MNTTKSIVFFGSLAIAAYLFMTPNANRPMYNYSNYPDPQQQEALLRATAQGTGSDAVRARQIIAERYPWVSYQS